MNNNKAEGVPLSTGATGRDADLAGASDPAQAVGARLAAMRVEKGRTVDEMSSRLKIPPAKVIAIESGDLAVLHDAAFAVGLVRSYAKVLGMDPEPLTDALRGVRRNAPDLNLPSTSAKVGSVRRANVPLSWSTRRSDRRSWVWGGIAAVIVLALLVIWRVGNEPNGWLQKFKGEAASDVVAANPGAVSNAVVANLPPVGASGMTDSSAAAGSSAEATNTITAALAAPSQALAAAASDAGSAAAATLAAVSSAHPATSAGPAANASAPAAGSSRLTIQVSQDTWMSVKGQDGHGGFSGIVRAGQSQVIDGVRPLKVVVGNMTGVTSMEQDGKQLDVKRYAGAGRNVARFTLP